MSFAESLPRARHCSKYLTWIFLLNPPNNPRRKVIFLSQYTEKNTEGLTNVLKVTWPISRSPGFISGSLILVTLHTVPTIKTNC